MLIMCQRNSRSHFGDVLDSRGTLTFELPKITGQGTWLCNLALLMSMQTLNVFLLIYMILTLICQLYNVVTNVFWKQRHIC